ncbi:MAG TPA: helix-turn-helix domain-containing protein [Flavobacterium sp.]|nr:helix-turn-helix domain-containing protein [Flavobacterium sp.]
MRFAILILIYLYTGCAGIAWAQQKPKPDALLLKAYELVYNSPDQAIKVGEHLLKNSDSDTKRAAATMLIAESYLSKGDYNRALDFAFRAGNYAKSTEEKALQVKILVFKSGIFRTLLLEGQARHYLAEADAINNELTQNDQFWAKGHLLQDAAAVYIRDKKPEKSLQLLKEAQADFVKSATREHNDLINSIAVDKGKAYICLSKPDSAAYFFSKALSYYQNENTRNLLGQATVLNEFGKIYFQQKQHSRAVDTLFSALKIAEKLHNIPLLTAINKQLAINFVALNDRSSYSQYNRKFMALSNDLETLETESTNTAFNGISKEQEYNAAVEEKKYAVGFYVAVIVFSIFMTLAIILFFRNRARQKRYIEIAAYLELSKNAIAPIKKEPAKSLIIPAETEQALLAKLKKFESSTRFTNKEMSLAMLSSQLETNTKYLSEIINRHHHDNFNTYINKLRIGYIIEKMKTDPTYLNYKISYLAEESGFSSHSSFATIFKSITGIAPTTFIDFLKEDMKTKKKLV